MLNKKNKVLLISLAAFVASLFLHIFLNLSLPLYVSGFFLALYIPGFAIKNILDPKEDIINNLLTAPVFTIFFFIPIYYGVTKILDGQMNFPIAFALLITIALLSVLKTCTDADPRKNDKTDRRYLFFGIGAFVLVHFFSTLAYKFIPEVDGYTDLLKVEGIISSGFFNISLRPLFDFLVSYVALISHIPPYFLFKFGMIIIQTTGIYYLYQFIKQTNIQSSFTKYLIMFSFVSIPVINLEIDYIRPNVIFIFALLPFIYYLSSGIERQKRNLIFSTLIATTGLLFHEFFGILFLINALFIAHYFYKGLDNTNKPLVLFGSTIIAFIVLINIHHFPILPLFIYSAQQFLQLVSDGLEWKWWFLDTYSNMDGYNLGWTGLIDVIRYYAYSLSPMLAMVLLAYPITLWSKIKNNENISSAERVALSIVCIGLVFTELLPRINYPTLPDRFWPMISLSLLVLVPFIFAKIKLLEKKSLSQAILILLLIGTIGSLYIARAKGGYVSEREYKAAQWIKESTPENAIFVTQIGNGPLLGYFSKRNIIVPQSSFFLAENKQLPASEISTSDHLYKKIITLFNESLREPDDDRLLALNSYLKKYQEEIKKEKLLQTLENPQFIPSENNKNTTYVLYSRDKFNNYYAKRAWWRIGNFYNADLNKFKEGYDLVYNDSDMVYIWKKK